MNTPAKRRREPPRTLLKRDVKLGLYAQRLQQRQKKIDEAFEAFEMSGCAGPSAGVTTFEITYSAVGSIFACINGVTALETVE